MKEDEGFFPEAGNVLQEDSIRVIISGNKLKEDDSGNQEAGSVLKEDERGLKNLGKGMIFMETFRKFEIRVANFKVHV